ncbi:MAG: hypothetical protein GXP14_07630, partial [Gammaproteobacteria bacterium]|nr:hypothetical protein [Gammaproteobacteria bacterium]
MVNTDSFLLENLENITKSYQNFTRDYGDVTSLKTKDLSSTKKEQCQKQAKYIFKLSKAIKANRRRLLTHKELPIYNDNEGLLAYYENTIEPLMEHFHGIENNKLRDLFKLISLEAITLDTSSKPVLKECLNDLIHDAFDEIFANEGGYMSLKWAHREYELDDLIEISSSLYFTPDIW